MRTDLEKLTDARLTPTEKRVRRVKEAGVIRSPYESRQLASARLRTAIAELTEANIEEVQHWLDQVSLDDPAKALDLLLRMLEFSVPKLSRVEAQISDGRGTPLGELTISDLQALINAGRTIQGKAEEVADAEFKDLI